MRRLSIKAIFFVLCSVLLGLVSAWFLNEAALKQDISLSALFLVMVIVATVNAGRFLLWGYIHKHFPLSLSYPLTSLFFPSILLMAYLYGDPVSLYQISGVILITSGVAIMTYEGSCKDN